MAGWMDEWDGLKDGWTEFFLFVFFFFLEHKFFHFFTFFF